MSLAVMQPYFFPYIGYFQLVQCVDTFIFYDDVNFIKGGWINRNKILVNGAPDLITIACRSISSYKTIRETDYEINEKHFKTLHKKINQSYARAPFKKEVLVLVLEALDKRNGSIADLAANSVILVSKYLGIKTRFKFSSECHHESKGKNKLDRLLDICKKENIQEYINPIGGKEIYHKEDFKEQNIDLFFLKSKEIVYKQFVDDFTPNLSMIDVLMYNSKEYIVNELLPKYELI